MEFFFEEPNPSGVLEIEIMKLVGNADADLETVTFVWVSVRVCKILRASQSFVRRADCFVVDT